MNKPTFDQFILLKKAILALITPSVNPDVFTDLVAALEHTEDNLTYSLLDKKEEEK